MKIIYIDDNIRKFDGIIKEGGFSRNNAWDQWLRGNISELVDVKLKKGKIYHNFQVYLALLHQKDAIFFFQYPLVGVPLFYKNIVEKILSDIFFLCLQICIKRNKIIFDICDLKYEQAITLRFSEHVMKQPFQKIEKKLFSIGANYIFASHHTRDYACKKYNINIQNTDVCINGGMPLSELSDTLLYPDPQKINYVYAGTLDQSRQIKELIKCFPSDNNIHLYLLGIGGEWIENTHKNISYLGAMEESKAHYFVSLCDIGLIPYDEKRLYYQLAYPTKLSFYITAGIAYLSTPVGEAKLVHENIMGGWLAPMEKWSQLMNSISKEKIERKKVLIRENMQNYYWEKILGDNRFIH